MLSVKNFDFGFYLSCSYNKVMISNETEYSSTILANPQITMRSYNNYANCKEDEASTIFLLNLLIDWISRKIVPLVVLLLRYIVCRGCRSKKIFKSPYDDINSVSSHLLFNIQIYLLVPFFPFILLISPILLLIDFKYEVFMLKYYYEKPEKMTLQEKSGYFVMTLFTFAMIGIIIAFVLFFVNPVSHHNYMQCYQDSAGVVYEYYNSTFNCGPYANNEVPKSTVYQTFASNTV